MSRGWDDPRMPTLAGPAPARRAGRRRSANSSRRVGVARANSVVDVAMFDSAIRDVLNRTAPRRMAVLRPLKLVIENYPEGQSEELEAVNHPDDPAPAPGGSRSAASSMSSATISWRTRRRSSTACRRGARCGCATPISSPAARSVKNAAGEVVELRCTYDPATRGGNAPGRAQGARHDPLGVGGACGAGRDPALRPAVHPPRSRRRRRSARRPQPGFARSPDRGAGRAGAGRRQRAARRCSSSGRAISAATRTRRRAGWCSTARSGCATAGRRRKAAA